MLLNKELMTQHILTPSNTTVYHQKYSQTYSVHNQGKLLHIPSLSLGYN